MMAAIDEAAGRKDYEEVVRLSTSAIESYGEGDARDLSKLHNWCAGALVLLDKCDQALQELDRAIDIDASYAENYLNRATILKKLERHDAALKSLLVALEINTDFERDQHFQNVRNEVVDRLLDMESAGKQHDDAVRIFTDAINLFVHDPPPATLLLSRSVGFYHLDKWDEALADSDRAIELAPNSADAHMTRGVIICESSAYNSSSNACTDLDEARKSMLRAYELDPDHPKITHHLDEWEDQAEDLKGQGEKFLRKGSFDLAAVFFENATKLYIRGPAPAELLNTFAAAKLGVKSIDTVHAVQAQVGTLRACFSGLGRRDRPPRPHPPRGKGRKGGRDSQGRQEGAAQACHRDQVRRGRRGARSSGGPIDSRQEGRRSATAPANVGGGARARREAA